MEIEEVQMNKSMNIALFLTVIVTTHFVKTEGGAKIAKYLNLPKNAFPHYGNLYQEPITRVMGSCLYTAQKQAHK